MIEKILNTNMDTTSLINTGIEIMTGCTIYNKPEILNRISNMDKKDIALEISKNILPELNFEKFKEMGFSIIFVNDNVHVLYNNSKVTSSIVDTIPFSLQTINKPQFPELHIQNLKTIIDKFNNLDISVVYNCSNINPIYWKLFTLKAMKRYPDTQAIHNANKHITDIISGAIYKKEEDEMKDIMKEINMMEHKDSFSDSDEPYENNNEIFRLEVMSYLNDNQVNNFLNIDEIVSTIEDKVLDYDNKEQVVKFISYMLNINNTDDLPTLGKIYFTNKLFKFILNCKNFLSENRKFMVTVKNKIIELEQESPLIKFAKINLTQDFIKTLKMTKELIASIEKN